MVSFQSYPWEKKGFNYYVRDTVRNRPQMLLLVPFYGLFVPICAYLAWLTGEEKSLNLSRFRPKYIVYRDDDPRVRNIIKFDENGKRIYLEPRTN